MDDILDNISITIAGPMAEEIKFGILPFWNEKELRIDFASMSKIPGFENDYRSKAFIEKPFNIGILYYEVAITLIKHWKYIEQVADLLMKKREVKGFIQKLILRRVGLRPPLPKLLDYQSIGAH